MKKDVSKKETTNWEEKVQENSVKCIMPHFRKLVRPVFQEKRNQSELHIIKNET